MTNLKSILGLTLTILSLSGCGSDNDQPSLPDDGLPTPALPTNGQVSSEQLKDSAVIVDGYEQITISSDSELTLLLGSNETFSLDSNEKLVVDGYLRITSN
ncbi:hypothetical protein AB4251_05035 [Vibrio lentus]|uniref:Uncharacterized protein n=1 Tax=Vibrio lentus TaxID=136468 RepID=A0AB36XJS4_9VIBR|nr:hypothetical protein [Vibrio lentus]MCC4835461.1 hypothetical protein [Vibrio lentus]PMI13456.1 hypothetical protein BCU51_21395 [Vibrio lentus]PMK38260.1 hypothetical protein BCU02_00775 [Vibrio lentus]PMK45344.1 hypothetical protein BCT99_23115 [Vibrio lentus]PML34456.1 hypothetical protein BCT79_10000 [Vibrio lentus]